MAKPKRGKTNRGFGLVEFEDRYGVRCSLQQSSLADNMRPGTSAVWLGVDDPQPQVMAVDAAKVGLKTDETCGWVSYPIPKEVLLTTRMHLDVEQVEWLVAELQTWLRTGNFKKT